MAITSKFSETDQQKTTKAGNDLHSAGTRYAGEASLASSLAPVIGGQSMEQQQQQAVTQQAQAGRS